MADLIGRKALVTKLSKGYWDRELQQAKNDPCVIDAMIDWAIRIVKEMPLESPWHTGTPTEEGWYLLYYPQSEEQPYELAQWDGEHFVAVKPFHAIIVRIEASSVPYWQKINEEEKNNG